MTAIAWTQLDHPHVTNTLSANEALILAESLRSSTHRLLAHRQQEEEGGMA